MATFTNYHLPYESAWKYLFFELINWKPDVPRTIVEVGSYEGSSAWWIMNNLLTSPESRLHCIDVWPDADGEARYELFLKNIGELPGRSQITVHKDWSHNALRKLIAEGVQADVLYIDGGHEAPTVLRDLVTGFDLVAKGGIVICDDYLWGDPTYGGHRTLGRPKIALDAFTTIYWDKIRMVQGMPNRQVYFQKMTD